MNKKFADLAWEQYLYWQENDKSKLKKINKLIKDIERNGVLDGIGEPEALKYELKGFYSRRIDQEHRLVYKIVENEIYIASCKSHYKEVKIENERTKNEKKLTF